MGAPISSNGVGDTDQTHPGGQLVNMVREGRSFSGRERNCVYLNLGNGKFADISGISGFDFPDDARSVIRTDWDFDGDVDLWVANRNGPQIRFLRNDVRDTTSSSTSLDAIAFRLHGTESNRDAIGARVSLYSDDGNLMASKTLRAGDGYLTQSSHWLTFANASQARRIDVIWPNGTEESIDLSPERASGVRFYSITEGSGQLADWSVPQRSERSETAISQIPSVRPTGTAGPMHTLSVVGLPIPKLPYSKLSDAAIQDDVLNCNGAVLLNLWASWCVPCVDELSAWNTELERLQAAGLDVIALSVDGLDPNRSTIDDGRQLSERLALKFTVGAAPRETVARMQLLHDYLFSLKSPLPVPCSFLLDEKKRIVAIYKGTVSADRVLKDFQFQSASVTEKRDRGACFPGRWAGKTRTLPIGSFVSQLLHQGEVVAASEYVQRNQARFRKAELLSLVVRLGMAHLENGNRELAEQHFVMARRIEPNTVGPEIEQGRRHEKAGNHSLAHQFYLSALERQPTSPNVMNNLAWLLATSADEKVRDGKTALKYATEASLKTGNRHPGILDTLSACFAENGEWEQAVSVSRKAEQVAENARLFRLAKEIRERRNLFEKRQVYRSQ